jgi:hypothetical protein
MRLVLAVWVVEVGGLEVGGIVARGKFFVLRHGGPVVAFWAAWCTRHSLSTCVKAANVGGAAGYEEDAVV